MYLVVPLHGGERSPAYVPPTYCSSPPLQEIMEYHTLCFQDPGGAWPTIQENRIGSYRVHEDAKLLCVCVFFSSARRCSFRRSNDGNKLLSTVTAVGVVEVARHLRLSIRPQQQRDAPDVVRRFIRRGGGRASLARFKIPRNKRKKTGRGEGVRDRTPPTPPALTATT